MLLMETNHLMLETFYKDLADKEAYKMHANM